MSNIESVLGHNEKAILSLRGLYECYGYKKYKMSKFEKYELYLENKSFVAGDRIVTFPDKRGKLLALKPDITLSIVKNAPKQIKGTYKTYYTENVYRADPSSGSEDIKEIMQVGIELIGKVDVYSEGEVLTLAARSLKSISENSIIGISHMGLISAVIAEAGLEGENAAKAGKAFADRNMNMLVSLCGEDSVAVKLAELYGPLKSTVGKLREICSGLESSYAINELEALSAMLTAMGEDDAFVLDFSVSNNMNYYNGITFQGFIDGIPKSVLSGGRYDILARKMGLDADAIGFAVYPDMLERMSNGRKGADVNVLLLYGESDDAAAVAASVEKIRSRGKSVCAMPKDSELKPTYEELVIFR